MKNFWGYYENENYAVGCTGGSVYVYNRDGEELARFRDLTYAYTAKFMPGTNIIVVKTTEGHLAVYNLEQLQLVKKIFITGTGAQDDGFAFSPEGNWLYNIERPVVSTRTRLAKYDTKHFEVNEIWFEDDEDMVLTDIEFDAQTNACYLLGFMRDDEGVFDYGYVGEFTEGDIVNRKRLTEETYTYARDDKSWQAGGFTQKSLEWSSLKRGKTVPVSLQELWKNAAMEESGTK